MVSDRKMPRKQVIKDWWGKLAARSMLAPFLFFLFSSRTKRPPSSSGWGKTHPQKQRNVTPSVWNSPTWLLTNWRVPGKNVPIEFWAIWGFCTKKSFLVKMLVCLGLARSQSLVVWFWAEGKWSASETSHAGCYGKWRVPQSPSLQYSRSLVSSWSPGETLRE